MKENNKEQFGREYRGYSVKQVDKYIEMLTENYEALLKEKEAADAKLEEAVAANSTLSAEIESLNRIIYAERENQKKVQEESAQLGTAWETEKANLNEQIKELTQKLKDTEAQGATGISKDVEEENKELKRRLEKAADEKERMEKRLEKMQKDVEKFQNEINQKSSGEGDEDAVKLAGIFLSAKQQADSYKEEKRKDAEKLLEEAREEKAEILKAAKKDAEELVEEAKKEQQEKMEEMKTSLEKTYAEKNEKLDILLHEAAEEVSAAKKEAEMIRKQAEVKMNLSNQKEAQCVDRIKAAAKQYQEKLQEEKDTLYKRLTESADRLKEIYACADVMSLEKKEHLEEILKHLDLEDKEEAEDK